MKIGETEVKEIQVTAEDGELIASVTDDDVISKNGFKVDCVPFED